MFDTKKHTVYAAGPMEGLTASEMKGWREKFTEGVKEKHVVTVLDPTRRLPFRDAEDDMNRARAVFRADLMDIDNSAVVFLDLRKGKGYAWGTAMEAMYAFQNNKPLIVWVNPEDPKHPFIESMATIKVTTIEAGIEAVLSLIDAPSKTSLLDFMKNPENNLALL